MDHIGSSSPVLAQTCPTTQCKVLESAEADSCQSWRTNIYNTFSDFIFFLEFKGLTKGFIVISFIHYYGSTQANSDIPGEKPTGVGSDGMLKVVSLFLYHNYYILISS